MADDFDDVRLPIDVERGATGGPGFSTGVITLASGGEGRNQNWRNSKSSWNIGYGIQRREDMEEVLAFFYARRGMARAFRFRDWLDFSIVLGAVEPVTGDATRRQLIRYYADNVNPYTRNVLLPVADTLKVYVDNMITASYTLEDNGVLHFTGGDPGSNVLTTFEFDIPARFDSDRLNVTLQTFLNGAYPSIQIVETRL